MASIQGTGGDDTLLGGATADTISGLGGNDTLIGAGGGDTLDGGSGEDAASYQNSIVGLESYLVQNGPSTGEAAGDIFVSVENLVGSSFNDGLYGDNGDNKLYGGAGDDTLYGWGLGNDWLYGGSGVDNVIGGAGLDHLDGGDGIDTLSYQLSNNGGITVSLLDPSINTGDAAGDIYANFEDVTGTNFDDVIYGDGQAVNNLWGLAGNDKIYGGGGYDVMIGDAGADYLDGGAGRDEADYETATAGLTASLADTSLNTGHAAGDVYLNIEDLAGSLYNDILYGDQFDNNILGWPGDDQVYGGAGNDGLEGGPGADRLDGGSGLDLVGYTNAGTANGFPASYTTLGVGVTASLLNSTINVGEAAGDTYFNVENLQGSGFTDTLEGDNANNSLFGIGGNDTLRGQGGDDLLEGGLGADAMDGGAGFDYAVYTRATAGVVATLGVAFTMTGDAVGDTFANIEGLMGSDFGDVLGGDAATNRLQGGAGNDSLWGGGGDDFLYGGAGGDLMDGGAGFDTVSYESSAGAVTASLQNYGLNAGEAAGDSYGSIEALEGSQFADTLYGYDFATSNLHGGAGDDKLYGGAANDVLVGDAGADQFNGGAGIDMVSYITASSSVTADMLSAASTQGDAAGDTFSQVENLAGSQFGDILSGDNVNNTILGLSGGDYLFGRGGDDGLEGGLGGDFLDGGDGIDTAGYGNAASGVTVFLLGASLNTGEAAGDTYANIENLIGSGFNDVLGGTDAQNTIFGGLGDDAVYGAGGDDLLEGGGGGDFLDGQAGYDYASYTQAGAGVTVFLGGSYLNAGDAAGDNYTSIEGVLGSAYADLIGGDNTSNTVQGYDGNDWVLGIGGDDWLIGGNGNDLLEGGVGHDILDGGAGDDVASYRQATAGVTAYMNNHLANVGEAFGDQYTAIENIWGSDLADTLGGTDGAGQVYGFGGTDTLYGYGGDDNLYGGDAADTLSGGTGADTFFFLLQNEGGDTITDFVSGQDRVFFSEYWFGLPIAPAGAINPSHFVSGDHPVAATAGSSFLFDTTSHQLLFDPDGSGAQAAILMATFNNGVNLAAGDIWAA
jgi:Ca2+-binding RTX toxin-like protein